MEIYETIKDKNSEFHVGVGTFLEQIQYILWPAFRFRLKW